MNYPKSQLFLVFTAIFLASCHHSQAIAAKTPPQVHSQKFASVLPPEPSADILATPVTYKLETYKSQVMGANRTYGVSLPPGYEQNPQQRYPVIFLLHGGHGDPYAWFDKLRWWN